MTFTETPIPGALVIDVQPVADERGYFARTWCEEEFGARGLVTRFVQHNLSHNMRRGTLRGLHYQAAPHGEVKVVSCIRGAAFDVLVDLRPSSPSFGRWHAVELRAESHRAVYIPDGVAHGFQTLDDETTLHYLMSALYRADAARGVRWDDPTLGIRWPLPVACISERDRLLPPFSP